jgi:tRNA U55 pseudouridine synthase TruB
LRRLSSGPFQAGEGLSLDALKAVENPADKVVPTSEVLGGWPGLKVMGRDAVLIKNGQIPRSVYGQLLLASRTSGARILDENGGLLALIVADDRAGVKIARVFH